MTSTEIRKLAERISGAKITDPTEKDLELARNLMEKLQEIDILFNYGADEKLEAETLVAKLITKVRKETRGKISSMSVLDFMALKEQYRK